MKLAPGIMALCLQAQVLYFGADWAAAGAQLHMAGNLVYAINSQSNLVTFDVSGGTNPAVVATYSDYPVTGAPTLHGSYLTAPVGSHGLVTMDVGTASDPDTLIVNGAFRFASSVAIEGNLVCVGESGGVRVAEVTRWGFMNILAAAETGAPVRDIVLSSNIVFAACGTAGLALFDLSQPLAPALRATYPTTGAARRVVVRAGFAYLLCDGARLEIVSVANPSAPQLTGSFTTTEELADFDVEGDFVILAGTNGILSTLNVSNRALPFLQATNFVPSGALGVTVAGNVAYVFDGAGYLNVVSLEGIPVAAPRLIQPVQSTVAVVGGKAVLSVEVEGTPPLAFQWMKDGLPLADGGRITGSDGSCLNISDLLPSDAGEYVVAVSNVAGLVTSTNLFSVVVAGAPLQSGHFQLSDQVLGLQAVGSELFVANGTNGVVVEAMYSPHWPVYKYEAGTPGVVSAVRVARNFIFMAAGPAGLQVVNPVELKQTTLVDFGPEGWAYGLDVVGSMVYVADGSNGLQVLDAAAPMSPELRGNFDTPGVAREVCVALGLAYVADGTGGLQILSVTNPAAVTFVGSSSAVGDARCVRVVETTAYVGDANGWLRVLDVSNPASPELVGSYLAGGPVLDLEVVDHVVVMATLTNGLEIVDVSSRTNILYLGGDQSVTNALALSLYGTTVYVGAGMNGVAVFELAGLIANEPSFQTRTPDTILLAGQTISLHADVTGTAPLSYQWLKDGIPLSETATTTGTLGATLHLSGLELADDGVYSLVVQNGWNMTRAVNIQLGVVLPGTPVFRAAWASPGDVLDCVVQGQLAFLASHYEGLVVVNCSNPLSPVKMGGLPASGLAQQVHVSGTFAYVAAWDGGLDIFDVFDPTNVVLAGHAETQGLARGVDVDGALAYVGDSQGGLLVYDVSDTGQPLLLSSTPTSGSAFGVKVVGQTAYVAAGQAGLEIFDVSDPLAPRRIGGLSAPGTAEQLNVVGNLVYLASSDGGLQIIDVADPSTPQQLGQLQPPGDAFGVQVVSNLAYVAQGIGKVSVVDVAAPAQPALSALARAGNSVHGVQTIGNYAFLADRTNGLIVAELLGVPPLAPKIVNQPTNITAEPGENPILSVVAQGTPPLIFQWYKDGAALTHSAQFDGIGNPNLRLNDIDPPQAGAYSLLVSNASGMAFSSNILVTVSLPPAPTVPPQILVQPVGQSVQEDDPVDLTANVEGSAPLSCRWFLNGVPVFDGDGITGSSSPQLHIAHMRRPLAGSYQLRLWNAGGVATSLPAVLSYVGPLQSQIDLAEPGQVLTLPSGEYGETLSIGKDLTLRGAGPGKTIFDGLGLGAVLHVLPGATVTVVGVEFRNGVVTNGQGGGIRNEGVLSLNNCVVDASAAADGGGLANLHRAMLQYCRIINNVATGQGGGVFNGPLATLEMIHSSIATNQAAGGGGFYNSGTLLVSNSAIVANLANGSFGTSDGNGAGIWFVDGQGSIVNATVSGNQAHAHALSPGGGEGGGFYVGGGDLDLQSCTISSNAAAKAAGGVFVLANGVVTGRNTIIAGNRASNQPSDFNGEFTSAGFNLLQTIAGAVIVGNTNGNLLGLDPLLGSLQDNGGPTPTQPLLASSPAVDAGDADSLPTDQRGVTRQFDIPWQSNRANGDDIGAFELVDPRPMLAVSNHTASGFTLSWQGPGMLQTAEGDSLSAWMDILAPSPHAVTFQAATAGFFRIRRDFTPPFLTLLERTPADSVSLPAKPAGFLPPEPLPPGLCFQWSGVADLQSSPTPAGPWRSLGAMNPVWVPAQAEGSEYFRLRMLDR